MHTGDGGYMDDDGFVFIVDRVKDMIITGGENVYSAEVENAIYQHPAVAECAVIGVPDDAMGRARPRRCRAASRQRDDRRRAHCPLPRPIANYKLPRSVSFSADRPAAVGGRQDPQDRIAQAVLGGPGPAGELIG